MNPEVIKISINQDEKIIQLLNRMLELKNENNKDVEGTLANGQVVTTKGCNNFEEALVANNEVIFQELENERNQVLNNQMLDLVSDSFKNRGMKSNPIDGINPDLDANIIIKEQEFKKKIQELETLDYSQPIDVYSWLINISEYVNDPKLSLYLDNDENFATKIVEKLKENNYTTNIDSVNTLDDYYKKLISYQLDELEKYHFFAYEKIVERMEDKKKVEAINDIVAENSILNKSDEEIDRISNEEGPIKNMPSRAEIKNSSEVNMNEQNNQTIPTNNVEQLLARKQTLEKRLVALEKIKTGELTKVDNKLQKSQSFSARKEAIEKQIEVAKNKINNVQSLEEAQKHVEGLNSFIVDEAVKNNSAMPSYNKAMETRDANDILNAIEAVNQLDDSHMYKQALQEALKSLVKESEMTVTYESVNDKNARLLEEAQKGVERLNSFIVDEAVKNNSAMPAYNKAMETREASDILNAIEAVNQLDDSHMYKQAMMTALNAMIPVVRPGETLEDLKNEKNYNLVSNLMNSENPIIGLEEAQKNVERLNSFIVDETVKNNSAMPSYNKAMETRDVNDILSAIEAVNQLDDSHMYKQALQEALKSLVKESEMTVTYESVNDKNARALEEAQKHVEGLNSFIVDESIKNNSAMPSYNKAMETRDVNDILNAIEAVNQLDDSHMYKQAMMTALNAMIPVVRLGETLEDLKNEKNYNLVSNLMNSSDELVSLQQQYDKVVKEEQDAINYAEPLKTRFQQEIEDLNKEIEQQQVVTAEEPTVENDEPELGVPLPDEPTNDNRPISHIAPLGKPLEEDYYQRLENAAKEGPIFHDTEMDLTPQPDKKTFSIKSIKKAPANLIKKIKDSNFAKKVADVLDKMKEHKLATAVITGGIIVAAAMISSSTPNANASAPEEETAIEQTVDNEQELEKAEQVEQEVNTEVAVEEEKTEEQQFEESLQETLNDILGANTKVYTSADRAINDTDVKTPIVQSWENATANTFYDTNADVIDRDEAEKIIAEGGEVVARFDNNGTHIGYAKVSQELSEDASGKTM